MSHVTCWRHHWMQFWRLITYLFRLFESTKCSVFIPGYAILLSLALLDYVHVKFLEGVWTKWSILIFNLIWKNPSIKIQSGMWNYLKYLIWLILVGFAWITIDGRILAAYLIGEILNVSVFFCLVCLMSKL